VNDRPFLQTFSHSIRIDTSTFPCQEGPDSDIFPCLNVIDFPCQEGPHVDLTSAPHQEDILSHVSHPERSLSHAYERYAPDDDVVVIIDVPCQEGSDFDFIDIPRREGTMSCVIPRESTSSNLPHVYGPGSVVSDVCFHTSNVPMLEQLAPSGSTVVYVPRHEGFSPHVTIFERQAPGASHTLSCIPSRSSHYDVDDIDVPCRECSSTTVVASQNSCDYYDVSSSIAGTNRSGDVIPISPFCLDLPPAAKTSQMSGSVTRPVLQCPGVLSDDCDQRDYPSSVYSVDSAVGPPGPDSVLSPVPVEGPINRLRNAKTPRPPSLSDFQRWHNTVHASGLPNFRGCRLPVPTKLNVPAWRHYLVDYTDKDLCDLIEFGFPVNYSGPRQPDVPLTNHASSLRYRDHVNDYISKELRLGATIGPLPTDFFNPPLICSPLQTVPKKDSSSRRIVVDFSFPEFTSVNAGISTDTYLGERVRLRYPSVDDLTALVARLGPGCLLYKSDLSRAYRQLYVDPADYHLLGFQWEGSRFADVTVPFGIRTGSHLCQRVTDAVRFIYGTYGYTCVNYLDDLGGADTPARAPDAFACLGRLLLELGLDEAAGKAVPPTTRLVFLGKIIDSVRMTIEVTPERLTDTLTELRGWSHKVGARRRDVESLLGKLQFIASCVRPGRLFISRMLLFLRRFPDRHTCMPLDEEFRKDLAWWVTFLPTYNGISLIPQSGWTKADAVFSSDACLTGCGGFLESSGEYFHAVFPAFILEQDPCINSLELLTILVCVRLWGQHWLGMRIVVLCDNEASVTVLNSGRSRSPFLQSCLRNLWLCAAKGQFELRAVHLPGIDNRLADHLSRWNTSPSHRQAFLRLTDGICVSEVPVTPSNFELLTHL